VVKTKSMDIYVTKFGMKIKILFVPILLRTIQLMDVAIKLCIRDIAIKIQLIDYRR